MGKLQSKIPQEQLSELQRDTDCELASQQDASVLSHRLTATAGTKRELQQW